MNLSTSYSPSMLKKGITIGFISFLLIFTTLYYILLLNETNQKNSSNSDDDDDDSDSIIMLPKTLTPKGIRLTFIYNYNDSIVISWYTEKNATDPKVAYNISENLVLATEVTPNSTQLTSSTYIYYAEIVNLLPNTTYHYQVSSDNYNKREIMNFTTLANKDVSNISFLVFGDSRTQRLERKTLVEKIMDSFRNEFEFIIHTGDIVEHGIDQNEWNEYFSDTEVLTAYKQGVYVEGNHEDGLSTKMYDNLLMYGTDTERYYSFNYGNVGFIILNSNGYYTGGEEDDQTDWLNQTLIQFSQENTFNFAFLHHPLIHSRSSDYHKEHWRPLFDKYNVSVIFCGHNHHYARSYPMTNSSKLECDNSERYNYTNLNDSIYIVTGGAGAPLRYVNDYTNDIIADYEAAFNFVLVDVKKDLTKTTVSLETWGTPNIFDSLNLIDNITITKFT